MYLYKVGVRRGTRWHVRCFYNRDEAIRYEQFMSRIIRSTVMYDIPGY